MKTVFAFALVALASINSASAKTELAPISGGAKAIAAAVDANGWVVASTGPGTYERFVRDQGQCAGHEEATPTWRASGEYLGLVCRAIFSGG